MNLQSEPSYLLGSFDLKLPKDYGPLPGNCYPKKGVEWRIATPLNLPRTFSRGLLTLERSEDLFVGVIAALKSTHDVTKSSFPTPCLRPPIVVTVSITALKP